MADSPETEPNSEKDGSEAASQGRAPSPVNSNVSRPMPRANTGSAFLNFVSNTFMFLLQFERRFDHWLRPPFDAVLRDPVARLVTCVDQSETAQRRLEDRGRKASA